MSLELLKGTLDVLVLKTLEWGPRHGYAISKVLRDASADAFQVEEGALYPALRRLERKGLVAAEWDTSDTGRRVRLYRLTPDGTERLEREILDWAAYVEAMSSVLHGKEPAG